MSYTGEKALEVNRIILSEVSKIMSKTLKQLEVVTGYSTERMNREIAICNKKLLSDFHVMLLGNYKLRTEELCQEFGVDFTTHSKALMDYVKNKSFKDSYSRIEKERLEREKEFLSKIIEENKKCH